MLCSNVFFTQFSATVNGSFNNSFSPWGKIIGRKLCWCSAAYIGSDFFLYFISSYTVLIKNAGGNS